MLTEKSQKILSISYKWSRAEEEHPGIISKEDNTRYNYLPENRFEPIEVISKNSARQFFATKIESATYYFVLEPSSTQFGSTGSADSLVINYKYIGSSLATNFLVIRPYQDTLGKVYLCPSSEDAIRQITKLAIANFLERQLPESTFLVEVDNSLFARYIKSKQSQNNDIAKTLCEEEQIAPAKDWKQYENALKNYKLLQLFRQQEKRNRNQIYPDRSNRSGFFDSRQQLNSLTVTSDQ